ncbi:MAG TPA: Gfo/Idh/MocA family oxidoreductase [Bellilinea sp.]|nr:Gfo/Idh/MocA family oxidoreductase [Bellilinea sp.]
MKFLIAGFGSIGRRHMRNLLTLGERDIVLYRSNHSTLPTDELADFPVETDLRAALAHKPDAVIISNPTALHLEVAIPAAESGAHLLIEKPIAHSLHRITDLENALRHGGGQALTAFQFRWHPTLQRAQQLLAEGAIGSVVSARAHWGEYLPGWHPWEDYRKSYSARPELGGGVVLTLCHPFDYLRWLLGEVKSLYAMTGSQGGLDLEVEDTAEISLRFASGALGSLHLDYIQRPGTHRLEMIGSQGLLRWDNADGSLQLYRASTEAWENFSPPETFERNDLFLAEMRHFLAVIRGEAIPACTLKDGSIAVQLALAAYESAATHTEIQF